MAHQRGINDPQTVHGLMEGVGEYGGPAGKTFFINLAVVAQPVLQQAGPALLLVEPVAAVGAVGGVGAVAVGVGVAKTEDVFFHRGTSLKFMLGSL